MVRATDLPRGALPVRLPAQTFAKTDVGPDIVPTPVLKSIARWLALKEGARHGICRRVCHGTVGDNRPSCRLGKKVEARRIFLAPITVVAVKAKSS